MTGSSKRNENSGRHVVGRKHIGTWLRLLEVKGDGLGGFLTSTTELTRWRASCLLPRVRPVAPSCWVYVFVSLSELGA